MNDPNVEKARASKRCSACKLPEEALAALHQDRFENGLGFEPLAQKYALPDRPLSESGCRRHFNRHVPEPEDSSISEAGGAPGADPAACGTTPGDDLDGHALLEAGTRTLGGDGRSARTRVPGGSIPAAGAGGGASVHQVHESAIGIGEMRAAGRGRSKGTKRVPPNRSRDRGQMYIGSDALDPAGDERERQAHPRRSGGILARDVGLGGVLEPADAVRSRVAEGDCDENEGGTGGSNEV